ncbi:MAG: hypothetical protein J0H86_02305 [Xanthomonadaceae bacterium]|nr:hypothetical protein [Xanthomonadaceae bacterium]
MYRKAAKKFPRRRTRRTPRLRRTGTAVHRRKTPRADHLIGLDDFESACRQELSGGMRQRFAFARGSRARPLPLPDEPFSARRADRRHAACAHDRR